MNLSAIQSAGRTGSIESARNRPSSSGLDVTISDRGVAVEDGATRAMSEQSGDGARPAAEARLLSAIAAPDRPSAVAPVTPALAAEGMTAPEELSSASRASVLESSATRPLTDGALGMYTGRGRLATMPTEGLAGQLIDVTG